MPLDWDSYQAPWEKSGTEPNPETLKRLLFNKDQDLEKAKANLAAQNDIVADLNSELTDAKTAAGKLSKAERDLQRSKETVARLEAAGPSSDSPEVLRLRVALEKGLPAELVDRLQGSTREEIEADSTKLLTLLGKAPAAEGEAGKEGAGGDGAPPPAGVQTPSGRTTPIYGPPAGSSNDEGPEANAPEVLKAQLPPRR